MTFNEFVKQVADDNGLTKAQSRKITKSIFASIANIVNVGDQISIPDFGKFDTVVRKARLGTNLVTNEKVKIPPKIAVKFSPTKLLKNSVNK